MLFNKTSNKTRNNADQNAAEKNPTSEVTAKPRAARSSKSKSDTGDTGALKHHRKASPVTDAPQESTLAGQRVPAPKALAAAAGAESAAIASSIIDSAGVLAPATADTTSSDTATAFIPVPEVTNQEIAQLAYSYWIARRGAHGSQEEDWLRAERELTARR